MIDSIATKTNKVNKSRNIFRKLMLPISSLLFRAADINKVTSQFIRKLLWKHRKFVILAFLGSLAAAFFEGGTMGIFALALQVLASGSSQVDLSAEFGSLGKIIDTAGAGMGRESLFFVLVALAVLSQLLRSGLAFASDAAAAYLQANIEGDLQEGVFRQFMEVSYAQLRKYKVGDLATYNNQVKFLGTSIEKANVVVNQAALLFAYVVVLLWLSWQLTLASLVALGILSFSLLGIVKRIRGLATINKNARVALNERVVEFLSGLRVLHTFTREDYATEKVNESVYQSKEARRKELISQATLAPIVDGATVIGVAGFLIGGYLIFGSSNQAALVRMATFLFVLYRLLPKVSIINKNWGLISSYIPFVERIADIFRNDDKEFMVNGSREFTKLAEAIEFEDVSLRYNEDDDWAVQNLCFSVPRGKMVALVGESGAGKSTTIDLLLRLYDVTDGRISIDGVDLRDLNWKTWRRRLGVVSQDTFIFHNTIRENIAFGKLDATDDEIIAAARAAQAHDFILDMTDGYETMIGDQGYRLSGGQKQRIAIARAILRDPDLLILDEATSSLDSQSERAIQVALDRLRQHRTVIAVAHRLSTIMMADEIIVLERGRVIERGTHSELLANNGKYSILWGLQAREN